ncbi:MAG: response regulator [Candidatus Omnitrophota bacterium]
MPKKVLVVDDDSDLCEQLKTEIAEQLGCDVDIALNGRDAVAMFFVSRVEQPYDLILLDIKMPVFDGKKALDVIRKNEELQGVLLGHGVPIIMLTGVTTGVPDTFYEGCDDYVTKPFKTDFLIKKIAEHLNRKKV